MRPSHATQIKHDIALRSNFFCAGPRKFVRPLIWVHVLASARHVDPGALFGGFLLAVLFRAESTGISKFGRYTPHLAKRTCLNIANMCAT